ncbi:MAG TPA: YidC/Oxa1 family membrane protein insertase [Chloroflexota bacterium]|nr:YidC/Oxa1 family membrane protein insertase [Chloroflexota bacterium]
MDIGQLWQAVLVQPLSQALLYLADFTGSAGLAIILFTIIVKIVLFPLTWQQIKSQRAMMVLQPRLKVIQKKYAKDRVKLQEETMRIYKEANVNPAAGCLPLFIQMPIWYALYQGLQHLAATEPVFQQGFLWISSLAHPDYLPFTLPNSTAPIPNPVLPVLTAVTQLVIQRMMTPPNPDPQQAQMNKAMQFMPLMFLFFSFNFPAGLVLYWVTSNLFSLVQQYFLTGWGGLFPGGYQPSTPFAGSWQPGGLPAVPPTNGAALDDEEEPPAERPGPRARAGGPGPGGNGRASPRPGKEKKRSAKR